MGLIQGAPDVRLPDRSLKFSASTDLVNCGAGASLDNLDPITVVAWALRTTPSASTRLWQKGIATNAWNLNADLAETGTFFANLPRATTLCNVSAALKNFPGYFLNSWLYWAASLDTSAAGNNKLFIGSLTSPVSEPSAYATQTVGSGTKGNNSAADATIGNKSNLSAVWTGSIACVGVFGRLLSLPEHRLLQLNPGPKTVAGCLQWIFVGDNNTSTQHDLSGNGNNGTVTGATQETGPAQEYVKRRRISASYRAPRYQSPVMSILAGYGNV